MNADPLIDADVAIERLSAVPIYFQSSGRTLFGWLHGHAGHGETGVIICKPFGFESISSHLSVRALADAAADVGVPSLRFDYTGTGDSVDIAAGCDQIETWTQDILAAVDELRRRTHVKRVCVLGLRLGALLAALAASRCDAIQAMVAIAPIISGRRYLRELKTFELAGSVDGLQLNSDGSLEVSGFLLHAATVATLSAIDLMAGQLPQSVSEALVLDRADLPTARAWADRLSAMNISTQYLSVAGFVEMLMRAPHLTLTPETMISAVCDWLKKATDVRAFGGELPRHQQTSAAGIDALLLQGKPEHMPTEKPVFLRDEPPLFGIVSAPGGGEIRRRGVILLNSGGDYHIGPRRMYVSLARHWVSRGYVVLRMDLAGLGDSPARPGQPGNDVFPSAAVEDIRAAVEYLRKHYSIGEITLTGLCSGAYHSFQSALSGLPIDRILLVNPLNFQVSEADLADVLHDPLLYGRRMLSTKSWRRLLTGQVQLLQLLRVHAHQLWLSAEAALRRLARLTGIRLPRDLGRQLEGLHRRRIRVVFLFSPNDPGIKLLKLKSGLSFGELNKRFRIRIVDGADHNFTRSAARQKLEALLTEELLGLNVSGPRPS